uniref:Uncharacterized protein LOC111115173 n=1 Tax=Crassostrea virginica TaxID=6565 RepID=A0A8B8C1S2_CRAVI|nr:uncharacterized protein LOC111115173 [Crassostrea virginica]
MTTLLPPLTGDSSCTFGTQQLAHSSSLLVCSLPDIIMAPVEINAQLLTMHRTSKRLLMVSPVESCWSGAQSEANDESRYQLRLVLRSFRVVRLRKSYGTSNVRNMAGDDAYVLITKKGSYDSTKEAMTKREGKGQEKMAKIYHHDNGITFTVGSRVNTSRNNNSFTFAKSEEDMELLMNADFESAAVSENWLCPGCTMASHSNDTYHGNRSVLVTDRRNPYSSPQQRVKVTPGYNYVYTTYFKLLNLPAGVPYITLKLTANIKINGSSKYVGIGLMPLQQVKYGWTEFGGDFLAPAGATTAQVYINIESTEVNFLQDFASMKRIKPNPFWMQHANSRINNIRKAPISFRLEGTPMQDIEIEISQQKSAYPFGTAIKLDKFNVPKYQFFTTLCSKFQLGGDSKQTKMVRD